MRLLKPGVLGAALIAATSTASATNVIDQSAPTNNDLISTCSGILLQSFRPSATNVSGAGVFFAGGVGGSGSVTISLWDKLPGTLGAVALASATGTGTAGSWLDVFWPSFPVEVEPNTEYYLRFEGSGGLAIAGDIANGYSRGNVIAAVSTGPYTGYPNLDYAFRTYTSVSVVPEPETYAMLLAGVSMLRLLGRRRTAR